MVSFVSCVSLPCAPVMLLRKKIRMDFLFNYIIIKKIFKNNNINKISKEKYILFC